MTPIHLDANKHKGKRYLNLTLRTVVTYQSGLLVVIVCYLPETVWWETAANLWVWEALESGLLDSHSPAEKEQINFSENQNSCKTKIISTEIQIKQNSLIKHENSIKPEQCQIKIRFCFIFLLMLKAHR